MPLRFAMFAVALGLVLAVHAAETPSTGLYGKLAGGVYTAPGGVYSVSVPVLPELGGQVHDTENVVTFDDDVSMHLSIACFPLDMSQKWELDTRGRKDYLVYFFVNFVLTDFQQRYPGSESETTVYVPSVNEGSLISYALLPGGSAFEGKTNVLATGDNPIVAKRGTLLFVRSGNIFIVSAELSERVTQGKVFKKTPKEENEILRRRLIEFTGRIEFPPPPKSKTTQP